MRRAKRILVTGGAGFLGSFLCERLLAEGHEVLCVDNFFTGSRQNVAHLLGQSSFRDHPARRHLPALCRGRRDLQSRLPGVADPLPARSGADDQDQRAWRDQHAGPRQAGATPGFCRHRRREVYGDPEVHPQPEGYWGKVNPIGPRSCYDEGKRCAETLFFDYWRQHRTAHQGRAHLQHLRPANASGRRPRRLQLHRAGAAGPADHDLRRLASRRGRSAMSTT